MKKVITKFLAGTLLAIHFIGCPKDSDPKRSGVVNFKNSFIADAEFEKGSDLLIVDVKLSPGFHAYAPGEKVGRPIALSVLPKNGWETQGRLVLPTGKKKELSGVGTSVVLEGNFRLTQGLKQGKGKGEAILDIQICSATACDRPREHRLFFGQ